ncbi:hypothetical protein C8Q73DRAFT_682464 [Cubamyces lactineus]|nr:hypothetical protein C8Q73DRAFT_682464 [Cubamyces lactineus]
MVGARNGSSVAAKAARGANKQQQAASSSSPAPHRDSASQPPLSTAQASSSKEGMKTRQKRVLPARSRRGGPGVGSCESDVMILETMKRKAESEPLIPATTKFLLTTNGTLLPSASESSEAQLNTHAYGRYFDRPEVQQAYKAQQLIQTPEFIELPQDANVGSRFRPRGSEDEALDTSDAAYEKRHRKYESFEKRQRLREKEKLKHEHYKLKERIDQLRAMDSSAFLALPSSDFLPARHVTPGPSGQQQVSETGEVVDASNLHGAAAYHEGERRRKAMLETALQLELRYRTLLPPDRRWMEKKLSEKPSSHAASAEVAEEEVMEEELEEEGEEEVEASAEEDEPEPEEDDGESEVDPDEQERERSKKLKLRIKFPPRMMANKESVSTHAEYKPPPSRGGGKQITLSPFFKAHVSGGKGGKGFASSPLRSASYTASEGTSKLGRYSADTADTLHQAPSAKRQRVQASASTKTKASKAQNGVGKAESISSAGHASKKEPTTCVLMVAAVRQSSAPTARKTQRHVTAFGVRLPTEIEEVRDFEIPDWVLAPSSISEDGDRQGSYEHYSYTHGGRSDAGYSASVGDAADYDT